MKILQVTQRFLPAIGGVERHVFEVSKRLIKREHDVTVFTSDMYMDVPFTRLSSRFKRHVTQGIAIQRFRSIRVLGSEHAIGVIMPSMATELVKVKADLIHAHSLGYYPTFASMLPHIVKKTRLVITPHWDPTQKMSPLSKVGLIPLKHANHVIALTNIEKEKLVQLGIERKKITVIPNGINLKDFQNLPKGKIFREKHDVFGQIILYVGRIDIRQKGCDILVKSMPRIIKSFPQSKLVFVGPDRGSKFRLESLARELGIKPIFTGELKFQELLEAYAAADICVVPSRIEPFGIVVLEAMACGKPVVASNTGGIPEIIKNYQTGILVPKEDPFSLASAICKLLKNPQLAHRLGENGRRHAKHFSWEKVVKQIENVYISTL